MAMRLHAVLLLLVVLPCTGAGQVIFGANNYTEYRVGALPVVISVPHGGSLAPASIPDRTCNSPTTVTDANTVELGRQLDSSFFRRTGCHPHLIFCHLKRTKLDCNRNLADGACGDPAASAAWEEFHRFIDTAQALARSQYAGKAFYIDLHGHGHSIQRLELGYLLDDAELELSDSVLNTPKYIGYSSIRNLVGTNAGGYTHAQLLRGDHALGTLLGNAGYPSVPSRQIPYPGTNTSYFNGGYNTANYTSYAPGNTVNGLQIECNYANVRDSYASRKAFADTLAAVLLRYLDHHLRINTGNCSMPLAASDLSEMAPVRMYPTLLQGSAMLSIEGLPPENLSWVLYHIAGSPVTSGHTGPGGRIDLGSVPPAGLYILTVATGGRVFSFKLMAL